MVKDNRLPPALEKDEVSDDEHGEFEIAFWMLLLVIAFLTAVAVGVTIANLIGL